MATINGLFAPELSQSTGRNNDRVGEVPDSLARLNDDQLIQDALHFAEELGLKGGSEEGSDASKLVRAAFVARDAVIYDRVAHEDPRYRERELPVRLEEVEKTHLRDEKGKLFSERGILLVTLAVSLAAFLQGHVQNSINSASLFPTFLGVSDNPQANLDLKQNWSLGAINAMPFFAAALLGCWLALPVNDRFGRRGAMALSAILILASSLASGLVPYYQQVEERWTIFLALRFVNGIGMGLKAVSAPILASETAIRFWRGSFILAWQLWVAFGIMLGALANLIFVVAVQGEYGANEPLTAALILGAPMVPAMALLCVLGFCPESPRYYMRREGRNSDPKKALKMLMKLRKCELLALKDIYLLHKTIEDDYAAPGENSRRDQASAASPKKGPSTKKFSDLFSQTRLRNALISSSTVALAQQLCGINISAVYSAPFFASINPDKRNIVTPLWIGLLFGAINWLFGLPAIKTIDTLGRRKWLIVTLPIMCVLMGGAAYAFPIPYRGRESAEVDRNTLRIVATFLFLHAAVYSPGLGPIPFTLASESFPLSHREMGCAFAIAVNLLFNGLLVIFLPNIVGALKPPGLLGLFCGLTFVAWVLVYFLVEETKELSLESLQAVFNMPKRKFIAGKSRRLIWLTRRYIIRNTLEPEPIELGSHANPQIFPDGPWDGVRNPSSGRRSRYSSDSASVLPEDDPRR